MTTQNTNTAIDFSSINYTSIGRREKGSDLVQFFAEKVLHQNPESIEVVPIQGVHKVVFSKVHDQVQVHRIKINGLNVAVAPVDEAELKTMEEIIPEAYRVAPEEVVEDAVIETATNIEEVALDPQVEPVASIVTQPVFQIEAQENSEVVETAPPAGTKKTKTSTKPADRTVFDEEGNVLRQAPIGTIDRHYVWQLEVLANEFVQMDPNHGFGICLRPAMWHDKPVSIMMTVYTMGPEKTKAASPKKTKINLLGNPEKLEEWLTHVQAVYDECASRLVKEPIVHESGFQFDREAFIRGELVIVSSEKTELTSDLIDTLKRIQRSINQQ